MERVGGLVPKGKIFEGVRSRLPVPQESVRMLCECSYGLLFHVVVTGTEYE